MKKPLIPLVKSGGYIASKDYTPLVYPGGKTTCAAPESKENSAGQKTTAKNTEEETSQQA